jgi:elongation factor G
MAEDRSHYGHVIVHIEPHQKGQGIVVVNEAPKSEIPERFTKVVIDAIHSVLGESPAAPCPVTDIVVRIVGGSARERASDELSFRIAGIFAIKDAMSKAEPVIIE